MLPYAVSALEWEALRVMCLRVLNRGFELAGYRPRPGVALASLFHGRVYLTRPRSSGWPTTRSASRRAHQQHAGRTAAGHRRAGRRPHAQVAARLAHPDLQPPRHSHSAGRQYRAATTSRARPRLGREALPEDTAALGRRLREQFTALLSADDLFFLQGSAGGTLSKLLELVEAACLARATR